MYNVCVYVRVWHIQLLVGNAKNSVMYCQSTPNMPEKSFHDNVGWARTKSTLDPPLTQTRLCKRKDVQFLISES